MERIHDGLKLYRMYHDGKYIATVTVDLPSWSAATVEVKGGGMVGTVSKPMVGQFDSSAMTTHFRTIEPEAVSLMTAGQKQLELLGSIQVHEAGKYSTVQHKIVTGGYFKTLNPGKFAPGEMQDRSMEFEIDYWKEFYDGEEQMEVDKFNDIYSIKGEDQLESMRQDIGM